MTDIRTGSIEMEGEQIDLQDLDSAYEEDLDQDEFRQEDTPEQSAQQPAIGGQDAQQPAAV
jgi:hypothetical protein